MPPVAAPEHEARSCDTAVFADVGGGGAWTKQFFECGGAGEDEELHVEGVEEPGEGADEKDEPLVARKATIPREWWGVG